MYRLLGGAVDDGGALYGDGPRGICGGTAALGPACGGCVVGPGCGAYGLNGAGGGLDEIEEDRVGAVGGDVTRGGGAGPLGGGGGGAFAPGPVVGGPTGEGPAPA